MITKTLSATAVTFIGSNHDRMVGGWMIQVSGTFSGALKVRKKITGSSVANASAPLFDLEDCMDYTTVDKATGITAAGVYKAVTDLCDLILDYTHTSGAMVVELEPFLG